VTIKTFGSSYDAVGHLITSTNPDSTYSYGYDAVDRISSIDNTGTVGVPAVKFNYSYDAVGNLLTVNDSINGTNAGITGYTYDELNRVTKLTQGGTGVQSKRVDMTYNGVNQLTLLSRYSGVNSVVDTSYTYDNNQRLMQLNHHQGINTIANYDYGYDAADKLATTVSSVDGASNYSYDPTNQLTGANHTSQVNEAYAYDANGNRTSGGTVTSANNQLLSDGTYSYTYDGEGNRTKRTEIATGKVTDYVWDYRNRLASVLFKDALGVVTKTIDYIYDGNNQRIGKSIDGAVTERYVIDRNQIALVFDGAGVQTHRYLYGTQVDQVLADETASSTNWALADRLGTVTDLIDNSGVVVNHVTYDSFGRVISQTNPSVEFRYGYTGREADGETGLDYYRARYYDASNGLFISEDPTGFDAGDGNLTRYVGNSPVNWIDPTGLRPQGQFITPVDGDQSIFTGGGPQRGGGLPGGGLPSGGNFGSGNLRPSLPGNLPSNYRSPINSIQQNPYQGPLYFPENPRTIEQYPQTAPNPNKCDRPTRCPDPLPPFLEIRSKYPRHFELVETAIRRGKPTILTVADSVQTRINRENGNRLFGRTYGSADNSGVNSTRLINRINPPAGRRSLSLSQWNEYPYASTAESGINAVFAAVDARENNAHGNDLRRFYATADNGRRLMPGCKFRVILIPF
jgi:RHS repeat-associated protein